MNTAACSRLYICQNTVDLIHDNKISPLMTKELGQQHLLELLGIFVSVLFTYHHMLAVGSSVPLSRASRELHFSMTKSYTNVKIENLFRGHYEDHQLC